MQKTESIWRFMHANFRWLCVGICLSFLSSFGQTFFISIFAPDIKDAFHLSDGDWGKIYAFGTGVSAVAMIWAGGLADIFRVRVLAVTVLGLLTLVSFLMSVYSSITSLIVMIFFLRFSGQGMLGHISSVAMSRWFSRNRGKALAIGALGFALGQSCLSVIFVALKPIVDWRILWQLSGVICLVAIPLMWWLLKTERSPKSVLQSSNTLGMDGKHWMRFEALKSPVFWLILPSSIGPGAFVTIFFFLQTHIAEAKGWEHFNLVSLFPLYSATSIGVTIVAGFLVDRVGSGRLIWVVMLPMGVGFATLNQAETLLFAAVGIVLLAVTIGLMATVMSAVWAEAFGVGHIGAIKSLATAAMVLGTAIGPALTGVLIDRGYPLSAQIPVIVALCFVFSALAALGASRLIPRLPVSS